MSEYVVSGRFKSERGYHDFETTVEAVNEDVAREHTYSQIGSRHGCKRTQVEIAEVSDK